MAEVASIDSAGLGMLLLLKDRANACDITDIRIISLSEAVSHIFKVIRFANYINIAASANTNSHAQR
jgi:anti-anti-sigma regulatory factor